MKLILPDLFSYTRWSSREILPLALVFFLCEYLTFRWKDQVVNFFGISNSLLNPDLTYEIPPEIFTQSILKHTTFLSTGQTCWFWHNRQTSQGLPQMKVHFFGLAQTAPIP